MIQRMKHPWGWSSPAEERANVITHGLAAVMAIAALVTLLGVSIDAGDARRIITASVFGVALVLLYLASTLYHACRDVARKQTMRVFDHAAIYILIAASYTPFIVVLLRGPLALTLLIAVWAIAAVGTVIKLRSIRISTAFSLSLYLGMGWIGVLAAKPFLEAMSGPCVAWVLAGGVVYTVGTAFYVWERLPFHHAIWHLFVAGGSACHVIAVWWYVLPMRA